MVTLESVLEYHNMRAAMTQVIKNRGAAGFDGIPVSELEQWFREHPHQLSKAVMSGTYRPQPIKRVYIPKDNGDKRPLGIPTVVDRTVQQALAQVLSEAYEPYFSDNSFGFRPDRGARDAVRRVCEYAEQGYVWVIDLDLAKFFDTVNHSKLLQVLSESIKDGRVISLIHKFLRAKIIENGKSTKPKMGTPQGGPMSPILANILLNEMDKVLDERGVKFCRYADDCVIFAKSERAAHRIYESISKYIEKKLFLQINKEKTSIGMLSQETKFLGFGFKRIEDDLETRWVPVVHNKSRKKLKDKIRILTDRRLPRGEESTKERFNTFLKGWVGYYRMGIANCSMNDIDKWIRRRIRQIYLKMWKKNRTKYEELKKLKRNKDELCYAIAHSSMKTWAKALYANYVITKEVIKNWGWLSVKEAYETGFIDCDLSEPPTA
ncbi:group II intron reverse transcriptase/maturase [uncultured Succinatimonas sp.]|uniref:group II intron reverse transcriptase/maturase n=1 Tax=uncultured Succinatimonas sp. TaxID=1262973 RepID=UPI0025E4FE09|nr:group II intron reverse transcriptase/maturase [uncultured Succinatimonas sp.]